MREQRSPLRALLASARTMFVGLLLIFPGVISDVLALVLWLWPLPEDDALDGEGEPRIIEGEYRQEHSSERLPPHR